MHPVPTAPAAATSPTAPTDRVATPTGRLVWADAAKGLCIVLVVLHHLTTKHYDLLVPDGTLVDGFWLTLTDALRPVRMPLFFLISGMFAAGAVRRPWRDVVRRKVATPYYLYVVWLPIHAVLFSVLTVLPMNRTRSWTELAGDLLLASTGLWYLYALALYFVLAKLLLPLDPRLLLAGAAAASASASLLPIVAANRESLLQHFVFFLVGVLAPGLAGRVVRLPGRHVTTALAAGSVLVAVAAARAGVPQSITTLLVSVLGVPLAIRLVAAACASTRFARAAGALGRQTLPVYVLHVPLLALVHHLVVQVPALRALPEAPAAPVVLAVYPLLATALVTAGCLALHTVLDRVGLGVLFRLPAPSLPTGPKVPNGVTLLACFPGRRVAHPSSSFSSAASSRRRCSRLRPGPAESGRLRLVPKARSRST